MAWADMRDILATNFKANPLPVEGGGTGAGSAEGALANLGVADYAISSGKEGSWWVVRYASGYFTAERSWTGTTTHYGTWNNNYADSLSFTLPFEPAEVLSITASAKKGTGHTIVSGCTHTGGANLALLTLSSSSNANDPVTAYLRVAGRV